MLVAVGSPTVPPPSQGNGIAIPGWDRASMTKSAGVTQEESTFSFNGVNTIDYVRIPYDGTLSPLAVNCEISIKFIVHSIDAGNGLILYSRYRQGNDPPSSLLAVTTAGVLRLAMNNVSYATSGVVSFNTEQTATFRKIGTQHQVLLNGDLVQTVTRGGLYEAPFDWVFGSYLNFANNVISSTYASRANWTLLSFSVMPL